jgi:rod shape-determining protein MreD
MRTVLRGPFGAIVALVGAVILQTTFFGRVRLDSLAPDIVMVTVVLSTIRLRNEQALAVAFVGGLVFDALSSTALGLRAR